MPQLLFTLKGDGKELNELKVYLKLLYDEIKAES